MPDFEIEKSLLKTHRWIAGVDEAGRGAWAGPVVSAMVILDPKKIDQRINDSKKIAPKEREKIFEWILNNCLSYGIGIVDEKIIDQINILEATKYSVELALKKIKIRPEFLLVDAMTIDSIPLAQKSIIKGDSVSYSIAAASILAKVTRDRIMKKYDSIYQDYNFASHKGYGTFAHKQALQRVGACPIHRFSYRPIKELTIKKKN